MRILREAHRFLSLFIIVDMLRWLQGIVRIPDVLNPFVATAVWKIRYDEAGEVGMGGEPTTIDTLTKGVTEVQEFITQKYDPLYQSVGEGRTKI